MLQVRPACPRPVAWPRPRYEGENHICFWNVLGSSRQGPISTPWGSESHPFRPPGGRHASEFLSHLNRPHPSPPQLGLSSVSLEPSLQLVLPMLGPRLGLQGRMLLDDAPIAQGQPVHTPVPTQGIKRPSGSLCPQPIPLGAPSASHSRYELSALIPSCCGETSSLGVASAEYRKLP